MAEGSSPSSQVLRTQLAMPAFPRLEGRHPCFSTTAEGHARSARLHLPVSPGCNIDCSFCKRDFNRRDQRPGVATRLLTVEVGKPSRRAAALKLPAWTTLTNTAT